MPTPTGQISLSDVNTELSKPATALITLNDTDVRTLAQKPGSGTIISMNDLRGKSAFFSCTVSSNVAVLSGGQTATITFVTTSESYDFVSSDVNISAGSISALSTSNNKTFTGIYTPPVNSTGTVNIFVPANTFSNATQTVFNTISNTVQINYDTLQPTMNITAGSTNLSINQTTIVTFTSSESTNNFVLSDVINTAGTLSNFSGSGTSYTALYTPPTNSNSSTNISVPAGSFTDSFNNINPASNTLVINYNTIPAPTYGIAANLSSVNEGGTVTYTVTTTNFGSGTLYWTQVTGSGLVDANDMSDSTTSGSVNISSNSGIITRTLVNDLTTEGTEILRLQLRVDSTSGTVVATANDVSVSDTSIAPTLALSPVSISNGTNGTTYYSAFIYALVNDNITPSIFTDNGTMNSPYFSLTNENPVGGGYYQAGRISGLVPVGTGTGFYSVTVTAYTNSGYTINRTYTWTIYEAGDTTITTNNANLGPEQTAAITFQTNTFAFNFTQSDVSVSAGSISNFSGSGTSFSATYTPPANSTGTAYISVPAGSWQNDLGGNNRDSNTLSISYNTQVPVVYNPLDIHNTTWNSQKSDGNPSICGVVFYRDGTYRIYQDGFTNVYYWTTLANANSGVGKYVKFILNGNNTYISPTGSYGAPPNGFNAWTEMLYNYAVPITPGTPFVFVVEYNTQSFQINSFINVTIQISSSPSGSPILSQSNVVFNATSWVPDGGGFEP